MCTTFLLFLGCSPLPFTRGQFAFSCIPEETFSGLTCFSNYCSISLLPFISVLNDNMIFNYCLDFISSSSTFVLSQLDSFFRTKLKSLSWRSLVKSQHLHFILLLCDLSATGDHSLPLWFCIIVFVILSLLVFLLPFGKSFQPFY